MGLQEKVKETEQGISIKEISLERTYNQKLSINSRLNLFRNAKAAAIID